MATSLGSQKEADGIFHLKIENDHGKSGKEIPTARLHSHAGSLVAGSFLFGIGFAGARLAVLQRPVHAPDRAMALDGIGWTRHGCDLRFIGYAGPA